MKVILAGGGTGGHLYPGIAVAEKLKDRGIDTLFLVSNRGIEKDALTPLGYKFIEQDITAFMGVSLPKKLTALNKLRKAVSVAGDHISKKDKILLLGGFAAAPAAVAGGMKGCDIYIHEQNSVMGTLNRIISPIARRIFLSYLDTLGAPSRSMLVGNPVRKVFLNKNVKVLFERKLLILGGSGGSRAINRAVAQIAGALLSDGYKIVHMTGRKLESETMQMYKEYSPKTLDDGALEIVPYIDNIAAAYENADIVIARSGSGTVFETLYSKRPAIYIPFAQATGNHQFYNAKQMRNCGYAEILNEQDLTPERLMHEIKMVTANIDGYKQRLETAVTLDSAELIVKNMGL